MAAKPKSSKKTSPNKLAKTTKKEEVELREDELKRVAGGSFSWGLKI